MKQGMRPAVTIFHTNGMIACGEISKHRGADGRAAAGSDQRIFGFFKGGHLFAQNPDGGIISPRIKWHFKFSIYVAAHFLHTSETEVAGAYHRRSHGIVIFIAALAEMVDDIRKVHKECLLFLWCVRFQYAVQDAADKRHDKAEQQGPPEIFHLKFVDNQVISQQNYHGIDYKDKKPQTKDCRRNTDKKQYRPDEGIQHRQYKGDNQARPKILNHHMGFEQPCRKHHSTCCNQDSNNEFHDLIFSTNLRF